MILKIFFLWGTKLLFNFFWEDTLKGPSQSSNNFCTIVSKEGTTKKVDNKHKRCRKIRNIWPFPKDNSEAKCYSHISHQTALVASERLMMDKQPVVIIIFGELWIGTSISLRWIIVIRWFVIWNCVVLSWSVCTWTFSRSFCIHFPESNSRWIRSESLKQSFTPFGT